MESDYPLVVPGCSRLPTLWKGGDDGLADSICSESDELSEINCSAPLTLSVHFGRQRHAEIVVEGNATALRPRPGPLVEKCPRSVLFYRRALTLKSLHLLA